ncbi:MAG: hypothetical protein CM1200mP34_0050 [Verrucomicrobiales bacterium]|nr:MAG: hypothetical protein CM1200mP34_0050 [Verrucomicrobiales bacterium]
MSTTRRTGFTPAGAFPGFPGPETIRDNALALVVVERPNGRPSPKPYQPAGYYCRSTFPGAPTRPNERNQYRRAVYVHWQRQFLHPMFRAFDAPTREE